MKPQRVRWIHVDPAVEIARPIGLGITVGRDRGERDDADDGDGRTDRDGCVRTTTTAATVVTAAAPDVHAAARPRHADMGGHRCSRYAAHR